MLLEGAEKWLQETPKQMIPGRMAWQASNTILIFQKIKVTTC